MHPQAKGFFDKAYENAPAPVYEIGAIRASTEPFEPVMNGDSQPLPGEKEIQMELAGGRSLRAIVYRADADSTGLRTILWLHGGGFAYFRAESIQKHLRDLAKTTNSTVVSVDYRLAPENPFPAGLDDAVESYKWLRSHIELVGGDANALSIGGDSAGGNLATGTVLRLREDGGILPRCVILISPWLDLRLESSSFARLGPEDPLVSTKMQTFLRSAYAPDPQSWLDPLVSPVLAKVKSGDFPPTLIVTGKADALTDDSVAFAKVLSDAGHQVALHEYPGMPHYFTYLPGIDDGIVALQKTYEWIKGNC